MNRYITSYLVYALTLTCQQDHNNQRQQYGNDTVCIPVVAEGVDRTTIRATHCIMSNRVSQSLHFFLRITILPPHEPYP